MFSFKRTVFLKFQLFLGISPVFACSVVSSLAFAALKGYQFHNLFLTRHINNLNTKRIQIRGVFQRETPKPKHGVLCLALDQNRTDDLILTMDMLCQLSYKGIIRHCQYFGKIPILRNIVNRLTRNFRVINNRYEIKVVLVHVINMNSCKTLLGMID